MATPQPIPPPQSGSIYLEAAIILPALIFMCIGMLNIGLLFADYLFMSQIAREAALKGARLPFLSADGNTEHNCTAAPPDVLVAACAAYAETGTFVPPMGYSYSEAQRCGHTQLCYYGQRLSTTKRLWTIGNAVELRSRIASNPTVPSLCVVTVHVNALYSGPLTLFRNTPIHVQSVTSYVSEPDTCV